MKYSDFIHMSSPGDGSCFFHSIATIVLIDENKFTKQNREKLAWSLRKQCVEWLSNNLYYRIKQIGLTIEDEIKEEVKNSNKYNTVKQYLSFMRKKHAYAGQIEIYAISNILQRNVRVYIHNKRKFSNVGLGYQINNKKNDVFLYHNLGKTKSKGSHHFEPLYLKSKDKMNNIGTILHPKLSTRRSTRRSTKHRSTRRRSTRRNY